MTTGVGRIAPLLRTLAVLIAIAGVIDPAITSSRTRKPELSVIAADAIRDSARVASVARALASDFTVLKAPLASAAGTVIVGSQLPAGSTSSLSPLAWRSATPLMSQVASPVFVVAPDDSNVPVSIEGVAHPARAPLATRIPVELTVHVRGATGKQIEASLQLGDLMVDRVLRQVKSANERLHIPLAFVPVAPGLTTLHASVRLSGATGAHAVDLAVDVRDTRWPVLFYDPRPSWTSTFVRRVLERDARFVVTSRVQTSKGVSREAGASFSALDDPLVRTQFTTIIVGAPEQLTDRDVSALDNFMRRRGGSVVLLFDQRATARGERLTSTAAWNGSTRGIPVHIMSPDDDSTSLLATEWMWPEPLPAGAEALAWTAPTRSDSLVARHPIVWQQAVGGGRLLVSGALDAWKFRDRQQSGFESFWQRLIADAASAAPQPIDATLSTTVVWPGQPMALSMQLRDASLALPSTDAVVRTEATAWVEAADAPRNGAATAQRMLRLWPDGQRGQVGASFHAPMVPGRYRVHMNADGNVEEIPFVVQAHVALEASSDNDLLSAWAMASGGRMIRSSEAGRMSRVLLDAVHPLSRRVNWYPMRSPWWLVPLTMALCMEWWLRRRRGLA